MAMASARDRSWPGGELPGKDAHLGMVLTNTPQNPPYGAQLLQGLMESWASKGGDAQRLLGITPAEGRDEGEGPCQL